MNILMTSTGGTVGKLLVDMAVKSAEITSVCIVDAAFSPSHIKMLPTVECCHIRMKKLLF